MPMRELTLVKCKAWSQTGIHEVCVKAGVLGDRETEPVSVGRFVSAVHHVYRSSPSSHRPGKS